MNHWLFLTMLLVAALALQELNHAMMIFQIRSHLGVAPFTAMHLGSLIDWFTQILVTVAIVTVMQKNGHR